MTENERNEIQRMVTESVHDAIGGLSERLDALNNPGGNPGNAGGNNTGNGNGDGGGNNTGNGNTPGGNGNTGGNNAGGDNPGGGMDGVSDAVKQWVAAKESNANAGKNIDAGLKRRYTGNNNLNGKEI